MTEKLREIYALDEADGLLASLEELHIAPEEITRVVLTHLHQDHAGGCTVQKGGEYVPAFPNATYYVQKGEWDDAENADGQTVNGYRYDEVMRPLSPVLALLEGDEIFVLLLRSWLRQGIPAGINLYWCIRVKIRSALWEI